MPSVIGPSTSAGEQEPPAEEAFDTGASYHGSQDISAPTSGAEADEVLPLFQSANLANALATTGQFLGVKLNFYILIPFFSRQ
jgi:hypothetical protein